jgi:hypothetical protein
MNATAGMKAAFVVIAFLMASTAAHPNCSATLTQQYASADRTVGSLRPDKPAQMRVFARDGSEYTAGEALWMKGQLRSFLRACARGDGTAAASTLHGVTGLLNSHQRAP